MPRIKLPFMPGESPIIQVEISYPGGKMGTGATTKSILVPLVVDTGARWSFIAKDVIDSLALPNKGKAQVITGNGGVLFDTYQSDLRFPTINLLFPDTIVRELRTWNAPRFLGLLGMDILSKGTFHMDGPGGEFTLTFP